MEYIWATVIFLYVMNGITWTTHEINFAFYFYWSLEKRKSDSLLNSLQKWQILFCFHLHSCILQKAKTKWIEYFQDMKQTTCFLFRNLCLLIFSFNTSRCQLVSLLNTLTLYKMPFQQTWNWISFLNYGFLCHQIAFSNKINSPTCHQKIS